MRQNRKRESLVIVSVACSLFCLAAGVIYAKSALQAKNNPTPVAADACNSPRMIGKNTPGIIGVE